MKHALIDIGSNSMRLTMYEIEDGSFKLLFKEKIMAGLAGYVENNILTRDGIKRAYSGLLDFKETLECLGSPDTSVFATASLRNIHNTDEAIATINSATGYDIEIIGDKEEALLGYMGVMHDVDIDDGAFVDIGGASTEIVSFNDRTPVNVGAFSIGSLSIYREFVKKIIPGGSSLKRIRKEIAREINIRGEFPFDTRTPVVGVGGTSRAILRLGKKMFNLDDDCSAITSNQLHVLNDFLCSGSKVAINMILRTEPERIHTIVPGIMIMTHIFEQFQAKELLVSKYGVREGYLCQKILKNEPINTNILRTEN
ncbi:MAG TPA: hypothetical protein GX736_06500 [Mogibacterium sp.]|nr:hypothetical protein [Mogibacterium sp.]